MSKVTILRNENTDSSKRWETSCKNANIEYNIIDLTSHNWYKQVLNDDADCFLLKPSGETFKYKTLYDERLYVISQVMKRKVYPSFKEVLIYENKRMLASFLQGANIPMPETTIFYNKSEALCFANKTSLPIVAKTGIGASGTGVKIIKTKFNLVKYINQAFGKGIKRRLGPNRNTGNINSWSKKAYANPSFFVRKIKKYLEIYKDTQKGFLILQEYIPHDYEWRIVKIGDSWFGHQKVKDGEMASGTKGIDYIPPPQDLLDFCKKICDENDFSCMAIDIFEHPTKGYVVNELQTIFGHVQDFILQIDGKIGRYIYNNGWVFEEGNFNTNESYDLRLKHALNMLKHV